MDKKSDLVENLFLFFAIIFLLPRFDDPTQSATCIVIIFTVG